MVGFVIFNNTVFEPQHIRVKKFTALSITVLSWQLLLGQSSIIDNRDNNSYPVKVIDGKSWMTTNLKYNPGFSYFYYLGIDEVYYRSSKIDDDICPSGWKLPALEDWETLHKSQEMDVRFNGWLQEGHFKDFGRLAVYWTSTLDSGGVSKYVVALDTAMTLKVLSGRAVSANCKCIRE